MHDRTTPRWAAPRSIGCAELHPCTVYITNHWRFAASV